MFTRLGARPVPEDWESVMSELGSLSWLANTQIVFILIAAGSVLILVEVASPGGWIAGIVGVILLGLAGLALYGLPFSQVGLALIAIGFVLFLVEFSDPDKGLFGGAGRHQLCNWRLAALRR